MSVCLLITTFNRTPQLRVSMARLRELTLPDEILIVDDGGSDGCDQLAVEMQRDWPINVCYVYNHAPSPSICSLARNIGLRNTRCDLVVTSEPEVLFLTDVIGQMLDRHEQDPGMVLSAGSVHHAQSPGVTDPEQGCAKIVGWVAPFCALYGREWLLEVGGWDESFPGSWGWDDTDLLTRLSLSGYGQIIDPTIEVLHQWHPKNSADQGANERHFFAKSFHHGDMTDVVANREKAWGVTKTA